MTTLPWLDTPEDATHGRWPAAAAAGRGGRPLPPDAGRDAVTNEVPSQSSILSATRGEPAAIEEVLRAYLPRLQRFVHLRLGAQLRAREETIDIVQSTVRELIEQKDFEWCGEVEFRAWLFQAALNKIREKGRYHGAGKRSIAREQYAAPVDDGFGEAIRDLATPSRVAMAKEEVQRLEAAFQSLTEPQREVLTLARVAGLPHAIIAQRLGKTEVAVRQLLVRAMTALGSALGGE